MSPIGFDPDDFESAVEDVPEEPTFTEKVQTVVITCALMGGMIAFLVSAALAGYLAAGYFGGIPIQP